MFTKVSQNFNNNVNISQEHNTYTNDGNETQNNNTSQTNIGNSNYKENEPPMVNKASYLLLSISSGLSQFSSLSIMYYFKDELNTNPSQLSVINSIVLFPLIIKPLFGLLSDLYPLFGYRRKVYIRTSYHWYHRKLRNIIWIAIRNIFEYKRENFINERINKEIIIFFYYAIVI